MNSETDTTGDFTRYLDATYGVCYQFNNKDPTKVYGSARAGPTYGTITVKSVLFLVKVIRILQFPEGLKLLLQTDLDEYLNITESAGVRVTGNRSVDQNSFKTSKKLVLSQLRDKMKKYFQTHSDITQLQDLQHLSA